MKLVKQFEMTFKFFKFGEKVKTYDHKRLT